MNERDLKILFRRIVLGSIPLTAAATIACGSSSADASSVCSPPSHPANIGCGGGVNFCAVPDASTQVLADGAAYGLPCTVFCGEPISCQLVTVGGERLVECSAPCTGRRPWGGHAIPEDRGTGLGAHYSEAAFLEAASVEAFRILRDELRCYGAPRSLVRAAASAAHDEVRHARMMGALARSHGSPCQAPRAVRKPIRGLCDIAIENAVEGCVRETYGALVASYQASKARDPRVRAVMKRVAHDETRHAALAWRVASWIHSRLRAPERRRVLKAGRDAVEEIAIAVGRPFDPALLDATGLPGQVQAREMVAEMKLALWG